MSYIERVGWGGGGGLGLVPYPNIGSVRGSPNGTIGKTLNDIGIPLIPLGNPERTHYIVKTGIELTTPGFKGQRLYHYTNSVSVFSGTITVMSLILVCSILS